MGNHITDAGLSRLMEMTNLLELNLSGTRVTNAGLAPLAGLTKLRDLDINWNYITDTGLRHLRGLRQLRKLNSTIHGSAIRRSPPRETPFRGWSYRVKDGRSPRSSHVNQSKCPQR
jgi:hypothetical protein